MLFFVTSIEYLKLSHLVYHNDSEDQREDDRLNFKKTVSEIPASLPAVQYPLRHP